MAMAICNMATSTESTQLTWMYTWVTRLIIFCSSFLYSTHMDVGYRCALKKIKSSNFKLPQNGHEVEELHYSDYEAPGWLCDERQAIRHKIHI